MSERGEFSVYQFFRNGQHERVLWLVDTVTAVEQVRMLAHSIDGKLGMTRRIIITDSGDYTVLEWRFGEGVIYPPGGLMFPARH